MKKAFCMTMLLSSALTACGQPPQTPTAEGGEQSATAATDGKTASGTGTIKAIDAASGKVTLNHGPVTELQWPAMTMGFNARGGMLGDLKVGDRVAFEFVWNGKTGDIRSIKKVG